MFESYVHNPINSQTWKASSFSDPINLFCWLMWLLSFWQCMWQQCLLLSPSQFRRYHCQHRHHNLMNLLWHAGPLLEWTFPDDTHYPLSKCCHVNPQRCASHVKSSLCPLRFEKPSVQVHARLSVLLRPMLQALGQVLSPEPCRKIWYANACLLLSPITYKCFWAPCEGEGKALLTLIALKQLVVTYTVVTKRYLNIIWAEVIMVTTVITNVI